MQVKGPRIEIVATINTMIYLSMTSMRRPPHACPVEIAMVNEQNVVGVARAHGETVQCIDPCLDRND